MGGKTYYTQLRLDPLLVERAEELLDALVGPGPQLQALKAQLIERTEGNPFFLEESVRTLVETGFLAGEREAYHLARPFDPTQARAHLMTATTMYREMDMDFWLAQAEAALAPLG